MVQNYYAELYYHFVWRTKGSLRLITPNLEIRLRAAIKTKCVELGVHCIEVGGTDDHVHLLVSAPPTVLLSDFIGKLKGSTSHCVNHELRLAPRFQWGEGYGVLSMAKRNVAAVRRYVQNQKFHHSRNSANATMERCAPAG